MQQPYAYPLTSDNIAAAIHMVNQAGRAAKDATVTHYELARKGESSFDYVNECKRQKEAYYELKRRALEKAAEIGIVTSTRLFAVKRTVEDRTWYPYNEYEQGGYWDTKYVERTEYYRFYEIGGLTFHQPCSPSEAEAEHAIPVTSGWDIDTTPPPIDIVVEDAVATLEEFLKQ